MPDHRSVVLLSIDTLRHDCVPGAPDLRHLEAAGIRALPRLAGLERLAGGAWRFTQCVSSAPYTTVSHATMFTGLLPTQHGVRRFFSSSLRQEVRPLAVLLRDAGYHTCLMSDRPELLRAVGLCRGFDFVAEDEREAFRWWDRSGPGPRLLLCHFFDVHQPYGFVRTPEVLDDNRAWREELEDRFRATGIEPPERPPDACWDAESMFRYGRQLCLRWCDSQGTRAALELYLQGLERFDRLRFRDFVEEMSRRGILSDAVVVLTSDHGEGRDMGGRHALAHAGLLLDDTMRTPLLLRVPGEAGREVSDQVGLIDLPATILDLAGVGGVLLRSPAHPLVGRSLVPHMRGEGLPDRPIYGEVWHCVRTRDVPFVELSDEEISAAEYALRQRMLRWPDRKFCLIGQPVRYDSSWRRLPSEAFARRLYRDVLGRVEDPGGFENLLGRMQSIAGLFRGRIFRRFLNSPEFEVVPKFSRYDLDRDPLETDPVRADRKPEAWREFETVLSMFNDVDSLEQEGEPLVISERATEVVGRLQDLGYFE